MHLNELIHPLLNEVDLIVLILFVIYDVYFVKIILMINDNEVHRFFVEIFLITMKLLMDQEKIMKD
jgi:hypothetical protein